MISIPEHCKVDRVVAKEKIYAAVKASEKLKALFVAQIERIVWSHKLAPLTLHLPAREGVEEIQVFTLELRGRECDTEVLLAIDRAIPYPILFRLCCGDAVNWAAGYKKIIGHEVVSGSLKEYFMTGWIPADDAPREFPAVLDMAALYMALFRKIAGWPEEIGFCELEAFIDDLQRRRQLHREIEALQKKCDNEKQFDKRMELNRMIRELKKQLGAK